MPTRTSLAVCLLLVVFFGGAGCALEPAEKVPLRQIYMPQMPPPAPQAPADAALGTLYQRLRAPIDPRKRSPLVPNQAGVLWLSLAVALVAGFDWDNLRSRRNVDILLMQAVGWCFYDILALIDRPHDPTNRRFTDWVFWAIVVLTATLLVRALLRVVHAARETWQPALCRRPLAALAVGLLALDIATALYSPPDDAGYFINIGGQRLRERGHWPYGDPLLTGTPAAAYGPVLYLAHVPFQLALSPRPMNPVSPPRPQIESGELYYEPPLAATKLCTAAFHLLGVGALFVVGRRLAGATIGWALVALYCGSAFVLGVGASDFSIGGMTFTSHIAPAALTLVAFALLHRPAWAGAVLAASVGALFYPIFMLPAWLGYYWRRKDHVKRFLAGFALTSLVIAGSVVLLSSPAKGRSLIGTIVYDTIGHQESPEAYGSSPFGFWGQRAGVRAWLMKPMLGDQSMSRPVVLVFFVFSAAMFVFARGRSPAQLALITAAVAMGAQLWKIHATATYVTWYYPFLLIGLLCEGSDLKPRPHA